MYKLIRFYNQNRKKIFKIILIIVFILLIIKLLNYFAGTNRKYYNKDNNVIVNNSNNHQELISNKSIITGTDIPEQQLNSHLEIIDEFMNYCKEGKIVKAYNLLSDDCKEVMFPSVEDFNNIYFIPVFGDTPKTYTVYNWVNNIYKVQINENTFATGQYNEGSPTVDYVTVIEEDNDVKLNINSFIERKDVDIESTINKITVKVVKVDVYMDYSLYTFEVINDSYRTILLDDLTNIDNLYIEDNNGIKYSAYTHELTQENLKLGVSQKKRVDIKYYSKYGSTKKISGVCFSKIIYDYEKYESLKFKSQYNDFYTINVKI